MKIIIPLILGVFFNQIVVGQENQNIVLIVIDDMRYDEWSGGGHTYLRTPNIDSLALAADQWNLKRSQTNNIPAAEVIGKMILKQLSRIKR